MLLFVRFGCLSVLLWPTTVVCRLDRLDCLQLPNARVIVLVREPVKRSYSEHQMKVKVPVPYLRIKVYLFDNLRCRFCPMYCSILLEAGLDILGLRR